MDVCVLGARLAGCAVALELTRPGRRVLVLDLDEPSGSAPSVAPGGLPYVDAIERWGPSTALEVWQAHIESLERGLRALGAYGMDAASPTGGFLLATSREEGRRLADSEDALRDDGFHGEFLDHYMLEARFDVVGFAGAYWSAEAVDVSTPALVRRLAAEAATGGVVFRAAAGPRGWAASAGGIEVTAGAGRVRASLAVLASSAALPLEAFFGDRLVSATTLGLPLPLVPAARVPVPASLVRARRSWKSDGGVLHVVADDLDADSLETFVRAHFEGAVAVTHRDADRPLPWTRAVVRSADSLPFIGVVPGLPLLVCAGAASEAWAFVGARWVAEAFETGTDPTPAPLRANRSVRG